MRNLCQCGRCRRWFWCVSPANLCLGCASVPRQPVRPSFDHPGDDAAVDVCPFCPGECQCEVAGRSLHVIAG